MPAPWEDWQSTDAAPAQNVAPWQDWQASPPPQSLSDKLMQTWPVRLAKGAASAIYSGATLPHDVYTGETKVDPSNPEFIGRTLDLAAMGSPAPPRVAASLESIAAPTAEALQQSYKAGYGELKPGGSAYAEYDPKAVAENAAAIKQYLENENFRAGRAPDVHAALGEMSTVPNVPGETPVSSIHDLQYQKQFMGDISSDFGYKKPERAAATIAKQKINDFIANPPSSAVVAGNPELAANTLAAADKDFAALQRSDLITGTRETALGRAAQANSGKNIDNTIRRGVGRILDSEQLSHGFTPSEISMMEDVRHGTATANTMRYVGNLLGGGGGLGGFITGAAGSWYSPLLAPLPVLGAALKKGADRSTIKGLEKVDEATRMRSAMGEALMNMQQQAPNSLQTIDPKRALMLKALMAGGAGGQQ